MMWIWHNEEFHNLYSSPDFIRVIKSKRMRWARHVARMGAMKSACNVLMGKPEWKNLFGRPRRRWEDNMRMDLKETGWEGMDWFHLAQDRDHWQAVINTGMNLRVS